MDNSCQLSIDCVSAVGLNPCPIGNLLSWITSFVVSIHKTNQFLFAWAKALNLSHFELNSKLNEAVVNESINVICSLLHNSIPFSSDFAHTEFTQIEKYNHLMNHLHFRNGLTSRIFFIKLFKVLILFFTKLLKSICISEYNSYLITKENSKFKIKIPERIQWTAFRTVFSRLRQRSNWFGGYLDRRGLYVRNKRYDDQFPFRSAIRA